MRPAFFRILTIVFIFTLIIGLLLSSAPMSALYNDEKFNDYENMRDKGGSVKYTVPNLFREDIPFPNVQKYPLVVQGGINYVPLEMFFYFSNITLNTDLAGGNFYISNDKTGAYISSNVKTDVVATHLKRTITLPTRIFYSTRYVPAKDVCAIIGLTCEVYDNPTDGVYVLRISDSSAKYDFSELIKMYSPVKVVEPTPSNNVTTPPVTVQPTPDNPPATEPPATTRPVTGGSPGKVETKPIEYDARTIYLTFENLPNENTGKILDLLAKYNLKATFFCEGNKMLQYPELVRRIVAEGHSIGIHSMDHNSEFIESSPENFLSDIQKTNEVLSLLTKRKTRLYRAPEGLKNTLRTDSRWKDAAAAAGMCVWDWNINSYDYYKGENTTAKIYNRVVNSLSSLNDSHGTTVAAIRFHSEKETISALEKLLPFLKSIKSYTTKAIDETTPQINFFGIERLD
jgi:Predicted xylanase/chitin deacetylase